MKKKALITVNSYQGKDEEDKIQVVTPGEFYHTEEGYAAVYNETEISGMEGTTTTIKILPESFSILREGTTNATMNFKKDLEDVVMYHTPYGVMELKIETDEVKIDIDKSGGKIEANYYMTVAGEKQNKTKIAIDIKLK